MARRPSRNPLPPEVEARLQRDGFLTLVAGALAALVVVILMALNQMRY